MHAVCAARVQNEEVEPKRQAATSATQQLNDAIAAKDAALAKKAQAEAAVADLESQYNSAVRYPITCSCAVPFAAKGRVHYRS